MKNFFIAALLFLVLFLFVNCCQPVEEEEFDEAALIAVNDYVEEMTAVLLDDTLQADLKGWVREHYESELPLRYDQERREWLEEHRNTIESVRRKHRDGNLPALEDIAQWQVVVVRGEHEWLLDGVEVVNALEKMEALAADLIGAITMIIDSDGELDMAQSEQVLKLIEEIEPVVDEIRAVFFR